MVIVKYKDDHMRTDVPDTKPQYMIFRFVLSPSPFFLWTSTHFQMQVRRGTCLCHTIPYSVHNGVVLVAGVL